MTIPQHGGKTSRAVIMAARASQEPGSSEKCGHESGSRSSRDVKSAKYGCDQVWRITTVRNDPVLARHIAW